MKKIFNKKVIVSVIITGIFILFCGYGVVINIMYSNLRQEHDAITEQYKILESKTNTCEQSYATLLVENGQCSESLEDIKIKLEDTKVKLKDTEIKLKDTEIKLQKTSAELDTLKKN